MWATLEGGLSTYDTTPREPDQVHPTNSEHRPTEQTKDMVHGLQSGRRVYGRCRNHAEQHFPRPRPGEPRRGKRATTPAAGTPLDDRPQRSTAQRESGRPRNNADQRNGDIGARRTQQRNGVDGTRRAEYSDRRFSFDAFILRNGAIGSTFALPRGE